MLSPQEEKVDGGQANGDSIEDVPGKENHAPVGRHVSYARDHRRDHGAYIGRFVASLSSLLTEYKDSVWSWGGKQHAMLNPCRERRVYNPCKTYPHQPYTLYEVCHIRHT